MKISQKKGKLRFGKDIKSRIKIDENFSEKMETEMKISWKKRETEVW